ncbi:thiamine pyrophosphate-binding protein [Streptomyces malaysiensis subsp. malaysiensis]|uniref:thiamine pyrophosphate-binding protein n=1 Tax=Streptomyces malaysiensis TaxID=92644 RepID=UPI000BFCCC06|nr:thiamine pyrophosphate-binding protein [Streptomyces malaysiensis]ATL88196.1 acetolactate synthase, large subunit [Streptomyces malaysiensis]QDL68490.1 thiamine pyrophosphate-binding protein [Streptomyces malaysiensis]
MSTSKTGGQLVVDMLASLGVEYVFGVVGGQTLAISDAIIDTPGIELIHTRHENAAAVMMDAYGRLTGKPAACISTTGPGATNLLTGVGGAYRDSSPGFVITCNNNGENIHKDDAQNADHVELFKPLVKYSRLVAHASSIKQAIEEAYVNALTGNPGPVHLDFARDTIEGQVANPPAVPSVHPSRGWVTERPSVNPVALARVAERVLEAERPVIWLGNGGNRAQASDDVLALADELGIPVVTTFNGIGSVPTTHPLVFGAASRMGTALSDQVLGEADLVLALGNSLNAVSTTRWRRELPEIVQVDVDPAMIGRYYSEITQGVVGDLGSFARDLVVATAGRAEDAKAGRAHWIATLDKARADWWQGSVVADTTAGGPLSPADIVRTLREVAPENTLLIPDAGNPGVWSFLWEIQQPNSYIKPVGFGNMGFALPSAIAASLIDPERPVLALIGDGSLGMSLGEIETLARVGGNVCVIVFNDSSYGNIRQEQELHFNGRTTGVDFGRVDFGMAARAMGVHGEVVTRLAVLRERVAEAFAAGTPVVLDVPIDRDVNAWTFPSFAARKK